ncbi:putative F-box domain-containing protein [Seiridium cardinale]|uniref:F-box domain-containing protein n=1 Tax=Seiridium cardinale TaxID=138064 RepID=A0ABR2XBG3_9PEZI
MASGALHHNARDLSESSNSSLPDLLSNNLILHETVPLLPISALLDLAATTKDIRALLYHTPGVFRHVDLTSVKTAQFDVPGIDRGGEIWRNVQLDENLTEDEFYSGPLRGIFYNLGRINILQDVQTLVLDGLSVTADLVNDILVDPRFQVRILSIRETKNMNERRLMQSLRFACRPSRSDGTPRLKGLYIFGKMDLPTLPATRSAASSTASTPSVASASISINWNHKSSNALKEAIKAERDEWYYQRGKMINKPIAEGWAETVLDCRGAIQFDAPLCTGPRHQNSPAFGKVPVSSVPGAQHPWSVATFALGGCATCGCAPEGFTTYGESSLEQLPLLTPVPLHSSNVKTASRPQMSTSDGEGKPKFVPRCWDCIRDRFCFSCLEWWCESCYQAPAHPEVHTSQHVHIVQDTSGLADHEMAEMEPPKIKTRPRRSNVTAGNKPSCGAEVVVADIASYTTRARRKPCATGALLVAAEFESCIESSKDAVYGVL